MLLRRTLISAAVASTLAASTAYAETTIGGYGEMHYNNLEQTDTSNIKTDKKEMDFHRFVLFFSHDFNDKIRFVSELELEHALVKDTQTGNKNTGEVELEQAYIEIDIDDNSAVKAGVFLLPIGIINETHEPPAFYGVERNLVEKEVIPATWWEGGVLYSGHLDNGLSYDLGMHSGLYAPDGDIRKGRQKVSEAKGESLAYTARVKYTGVAGLEVAGTVQRQDDLSQGLAAEAVAATLLETHAIYTAGPFKAIALYAQWDIDDTAATATRKEQSGLLVEASYKVTEKLGVFVRQSDWSIVVGQDKSQTAAGINYWPHEDVVFKFDYQTEDHDSATESKGFNLGVGYQF